uniref:Apoptotic protease-activating factor 1 n=1 Tax=Oryzias latipes TaxID=8090 RepID=A0A3P9HT88_ORYLA
MALDERARACLLTSRHKLEEIMKPAYLMDHMISDEAITVEEEDMIANQNTKREQAAALVDLLLKKDNYSFRSFYNALLKEEYDELANLLKEDLPLTQFTSSSQCPVQTVLSEGGVPPRPEAFVHRPKEENEIREKLYKLQKQPGWVTVFGMAGSGKSVLASEAVRHKELIQECFPEGIHWLSIGRLDKPDLLAKIQTLCFRLEQNLDSQQFHRPPSTLDEAKERLRFLMIRKYTRTLLILDDVWDSTVLKAVDIHCRILLTTRNRSLADVVNGSKHEVEVNSGLDEDKALEILSQLSKIEMYRLPEEALSIVKKCQGSPLAVSMIGSLLRENPDRWGYYLRQLEKKQFRRIRKSSSYNYEALDQAIAAGIEDLSDDYRDLYNLLTVLHKDVKVTAKMMSVLWGQDQVDTEDTLSEFVNRAMLFVDSQSQPNVFYLHDLQLDFLLEQNKNQLKSLHKKMVERYQHRYKDRPLTSRDEESLYWIRYLAYHMANANLFQELHSLLFSLDWISVKGQIMGPAHLINDYLEYGSILDKENNEMCSEFQEFLSLSGHYLEQRPFPDIVQLALSQPHTSEVYRQARLLAQERAKDGKLYFDLINETSADSLSRLVIHPHQGSLYACFSNDGTKIASCGATKNLKVFKSTSGEKLSEFELCDEVVCCAFSPDDSLLAVCSSGRTIQVWNVHQVKLLRTFQEEHKEQINHCVFTNTTRRLLLATCSNDHMGNAKLWNLNKPTCQNTIFGHFEPVNHCCFSPDDSYVSTSSNDGTVKLFEATSGNIWKSIDVKGMFKDPDNDEEVAVRCSSWTADGKRILCAARNAALMFDVETSDLLLEIRPSFLSTVLHCDVCPTSNLLAMALSNYAVELWDIEENAKKADCSGHLSWVERVQFSRDGSQMLSCSDDETIRLWETKKLHMTSAVFLKRNTDVLFNDDNILVSAPDHCNRLQVRDGRTGDTMLQSEKKPSRIRCTCLHRDLSVVALGQEDGTVQVLAVPSGKPLATLLGHTKTVLHCQFTHNGQTLITSSEDCTIRVWNLPSGECKVLQGHKEQVRCFALLSPSSNDSRLLSWSFDGTVKVWNTESGQKLQDIDAHGGAILSCHVSPDGRLFATSSADRTAKLWHCEAWQCTFTLTGHQECVRSCRFSWDSECLATGDDNGEIRLWNVNDGSLLRICSREVKDSMDSFHGGWVTDLHFSPDNSLLVSAGGYIKWWDVKDGVALQTFYPKGNALRKIHVSSEFSTFVTVDSIGILYVLQRVP